MIDFKKRFQIPLLLPLLVQFAPIKTEIIAQEISTQAAIFSTSVEFCSKTKSQYAKGTFLPPLPGLQNDIHFLKLDFRLDPADNSIKGTAVIYFKAKAQGDTLALYLQDSLAVRSIKFRNTFITPSRPGGHILIMPLGTTLLAGANDSIIITYEGIPGSMAGQRGFFTALHNGKPYLWTLSEPYAAPTWWPCKLNLDDKIDSLQITISHPPDYRSAANGMLIEETHTDSLSILVWKHRYPIAPYLIAVAVGEYAVYEENISTPSGNIRVLNFAYPVDSTSIRQATGALAPVYHLYDSLFGPYPFIEEKYGHLQCPMGGGMEHQTLTFAGPFSHHVLSHELAHSWFGNKVTTGSWKDIWLNEGFATYATGLTYQYLFNGIYWYPWKKETISAVCTQPGGAVYVDDTTSVSRIFDARLSYHKAALLLHMMRWITGDTNFFDALRTYLGFPGLSYGFARTSDLISILEETSGQSLSDFMNQWFYGEGYPSYTLSWGMPSFDTLQIILYQKTSHPSVSFFDIPVEISARNATHDTLIILRPSFNGQKFTIPIDFVPDSLVFDPGLRIISSANIVLGNEEIVQTGQEINIGPNPARDYIRIDCRATRAFVTLWDNTGRAVLSKMTLLPAEISLAGLRRGLYILSIETPQNTTRRKLIIQ